VHICNKSNNCCGAALSVNTAISDISSSSSIMVELKSS
jgi:hypothetical protein